MTRFVIHHQEKWKYTLPWRIWPLDMLKSKPEIRPASYVTMVVGSIYCDKKVHTKIHLLSTTRQTCIDSYSYESLNSNWAFTNRIEGTGTVHFKMLKGTIFVGYQSRNFLLYAELPNSTNLRCGHSYSTTSMHRLIRAFAFCLCYQASDELSYNVC